MKCICITGATQPDLERVSTILQQAGMSLPKHAKHEDSIDIASWHEQALNMDTDNTETGKALTNPGRFMEQLASDIFIANIKQNIWGWADTRSTWFLDFWVNFDPSLYFVLVYVSPQHMLANAINLHSNGDSIAAIMDAWQAHYQHLLRFQLRNPQRSLLIDINDCAENPQALIERCTKQWKLQIAAPSIVEPNQTNQDSLAIFLAQQFCRDYPQTADLQYEFAATLTRLGTTEQDRFSAPTAGNVIADYRALQDRSAELELLEAIREELKTLQSQNSKLNAAIAIQIQARDEQSKLAAERQDLIDQLNKKQDDIIASHTQQLTDTKNQLKASGQENELLLLQLHQVQEELETYFLKQDALQKQNDALRTEVISITVLREEKNIIVGEWQIRVEALTHERDTLAEQVADQQANIEQFTKNLDETIGNLKQQENNTLAKLKSSEQENELLLLQLHQVQEELEYYFLQYQEKQKELQQSDARWQRLYQRNPNYCDYESIEVLSTESNPNNSLTWCIKNLNASGQNLPELTFKTLVAQDIAGFILDQPQDNAASINDKSSNKVNQNALQLIFTGPDDTLQQRVQSLLDISSSDWNLLNTLVILVQDTLEQPSDLIFPVEYDVESLRKGLENLREILRIFPASLRHDQIKIQRVQTNPDYEFLWLRIENLVLGDKRWPAFEFRLSCAMPGVSPFGHYPKLEIPEDWGRAIFENWFIESYDDFGAKLELRFALPESMDMEVWQRLSVIDKDFLTALVARLPSMLASTQNLNIKLKRSWQDWIDLAKQIQRIYILRVNPQSPPAEAQVTSSSKRTVTAAPKSDLSTMPRKSK